jgi:hypothetical protein
METEASKGVLDLAFPNLHYQPHCARAFGTCFITITITITIT